MTFWSQLKVNAIDAAVMLAVIGLGAMLVASLWR
jgi:hypothetical protein